MLDDDAKIRTFAINGGQDDVGDRLGWNNTAGCMEVIMGNGAGHQYLPGGEAYSYVQWVMIALP
jgi:hypothetical protein